jgi:hypothetical protein
MRFGYMGKSQRPNGFGSLSGIQHQVRCDEYFCPDVRCDRLKNLECLTGKTNYLSLWPGLPMTPVDIFIYRRDELSRSVHKSTSETAC